MTLFLATQVFTRRVFESVTFVEGDPVPPGSTLSSVSGSLQPISGREVARLPEGERSRARAKFYTSARLNVSSDRLRSDRIVVGDRELEVIARVDWSADATGDPHFKYILAETDDRRL